jgi:hypothetical protein
MGIFSINVRERCRFIETIRNGHIKTIGRCKMKKFTFPVVAIIVVIALGGLGASWNAPGAEALSSLSQPTSTPPAPGDGDLVYQLPSSLAGTEAPEQGPSGVLEADNVVVGGDEAHAQRARVLRQAGKRFSTVSLGGDASIQSESGVRCVDMLSNPQMDVEEFGDGTGSVEYWTILWQNIYYDKRAGYYRSPSYSLVMDDDPSYDTQYISATLDYDSFGQAFMAPSGLLTATVSYSRLYDGEANANDDAYYVLWTLDDQGYLDEDVAWWAIGESPSGWSDRFGVLTDPTALAELSGKPVALVFELWTDRASPYETIWLDDAQVTLCYEFTATSWVYLPLVRQDPIPRCVPKEPDSRDDPGSTVIGAACDGSFSPFDTKDYYSLNPGGVSNVRLWLRNLPSGTNWGAAIFEDAPGNPYVCHIGTTGSGNKYVNCTLNPSKQYFVKVDAGTAPDSTKTYRMSVEAR